MIKDLRKLAELAQNFQEKECVVQPESVPADDPSIDESEDAYTWVKIAE